MYSSVEVMMFLLFDWLVLINKGLVAIRMLGSGLLNMLEPNITIQFPFCF